MVFDGCRVTVSLASGFCPPVDQVGPGACVGFLVGGTSACVPVSPVTLMGRITLGGGGALGCL